MKKNLPPGKFVVFEGIDGAGDETQTKLLFNYLKKQKKSVKKLSYPDYQTPIGKLIHQYLYKKYNFSVETQFLLYLTDFIKDKENLKKWLKQGKIVISDRYFTSTIAYQGLKGFPIKKALKIAELLELPKPDLIIYLKISPQVSIQRKSKEKRILDRNEANKKLQSQLASFYEKLTKKQVFSRWVIIDGERPILEVFEKVKKIVCEKRKLG